MLNRIVLVLDLRHELLVVSDLAEERISLQLFLDLLQLRLQPEFFEIDIVVPLAQIVVLYPDHLQLLLGVSRLHAGRRKLRLVHPVDSKKEGCEMVCNPSRGVDVQKGK